MLVPVLYLAQANNRLAPNGALIQGQDVTLISGSNLTNAGTLRATNNLAVSAGSNLLNTGLMEAGNRADLLATNSLVNSNGGIIKGQDITLTATNGDVTNETSLTTHNSAKNGATWTRTFVDSAASVEAGNTLAINAGHDVNNSGTLKSGGDMSIAAGNDVNIASVQKVDGQTSGTKHTNQQITQVAANVSAGGNLTITAANDINVTASNVSAKGNLALAAGNDITVSSAADESHSYFKNHTHEIQNDHVAQVAGTLAAGGDLSVQATHDLTFTASKASAGGEAYLYAGNNLSLNAAQNQDYSLYDMKKSSGFGSKKTQHDEVTQNTWIGSEVKSGGNLSLVSGKDQVYQVAKLDSGKDLTIQSGGGITFAAEKDRHDESHTKSNNSLAWTSMSGKGNTDETLRQTEMVAKGQLVINAVNQIHIDVKEVNQQTVSQTIDAMVKADPELSWIKDEEAKGNIDWRQVKEIHDSFKYSHSGLGEGAMLVIIIIVSVLTAGAASGEIGALMSGAGSTFAAGTAAAAATGTTAAVAATSAGLGNVMLTAVATSLASSGAVNVINNKGNLGAAVKETFSADGVKGAAIAGFTAGALSYVDTTYFSTPTGADGGTHIVTDSSIQNPGYSSDMLSWNNAEQTVLRSTTHAVIDSGITTAINGGSLSKNLGTALVGESLDLVAAAGNDAVGDLGASPGSAQAVLSHALLGGALSVAKGGDFYSGAIAGGAAEGLTPILNNALAKYVSDQYSPTNLSEQSSQLRIATAQIVGLLAAGSRWRPECR